jgi:hypothetical protein
MNWYVSWVAGYPVASAFLQFAILGTLGEVLSLILRNRDFALHCSFPQMVGKIAAWGVLGIIIKFGFVGMRGFVNALLEHDLLPVVFSGVIGGAFAVSVVTNLLFGPQMMLFHRFEENLVMREWNWAGLQKAWLTLIWFWIPAHTVTFAMPKDFQVGLAALWSVALGLIMGLTTPKPAHS